MAAAWFTMIMGEVAGPFAARQLLAVARSGELRIDDWVRKGEDGDWVRAENVIGLFDVPSLPVVVGKSVAVIDGFTAASQANMATNEANRTTITNLSEASRATRIQKRNHPEGNTNTTREKTVDGREIRGRIVIPRRVVVKSL